MSKSRFGFISFTLWYQDLAVPLSYVDFLFCILRLSLRTIKKSIFLISFTKPVKRIDLSLPMIWNEQLNQPHDE